MNEGGTISALIDLLQIDYKGRGVMLCVGQYLGAEEGDDMVRYHTTRFVLEIGVVDTEVRVKPVDFASDEFTRNKPLSGRND